MEKRHARKEEEEGRGGEGREGSRKRKFLLQMKLYTPVGCKDLSGDDIWELKCAGGGRGREEELS